MTTPATRRRVRRPADAPPPQPGEYGHAYLAGLERAADRRARLITHIRHSIETHQRPPTVDELATLEQVHRRTIHTDLDTLRAAGAIEWDTVHGRRVVRIPGHRAQLVKVTP